MVLYTKQDCPLCSVVKLKLNSVGINYTISTDEDAMAALNIDRLPVLVLKNGMKLEFGEIIKYVQGGNLINED